MPVINCVFIAKTRWRILTVSYLFICSLCIDPVSHVRVHRDIEVIWNEAVTLFWYLPGRNEEYSPLKMEKVRSTETSVNIYQAIQYHILKTVNSIAITVRILSQSTCKIFLFKHKNSGVLVRQRTIRTERPPLVDEVSANFSG
jgi:hypothetical protein